MRELWCRESVNKVNGNSDGISPMDSRKASMR